MSSLQEFTAQVKTGGLAKQNRFSILMGIPNVLQQNFGNEQIKLVMLFCESTSLPGFNVATTPIRTYGEFREMPYEPIYENINATFYVDRQMTVKKYFDDWMLNIYNPVTRHANYYNDYTCTIDIYQYDQANNTTYAVRLYDVYPKSIGAMALDNNSRDIHKITVAFNYRYWRPQQMQTTNVASENPFNYAFQNYANVVTQFNSTFDSLPASVPVPNTYLDNFSNFQNTINQQFGSIPGMSVGNPGNLIQNQIIVKAQTKLQGILGGFR